MNRVRFVKPQYKLSQQIDEPGGRTVALAVQAAEEGVGTLKNAAVGAVDSQLSEVDEAFAAVPETFDPAAMGKLYDRVNGLIGICSTADLKDMDKAAYILCDLLDRMMAARRMERVPIAVHVQALHILRKPPAALQVKEMLQGLARVRQKYS